MHPACMHRRMSAPQMYCPDREAKAQERLCMSFHVFLFTLANTQRCFLSPRCQIHHWAANFPSSHEPPMSTGWFADPVYNNLNQTSGLSWHRVTLLMNCMKSWMIISIHSDCNASLNAIWNFIQLTVTGKTFVQLSVLSPEYSLFSEKCGSSQMISANRAGLLAKTKHFRFPIVCFTETHTVKNTSESFIWFPQPSLSVDVLIKYSKITIERNIPWKSRESEHNRCHTILRRGKHSCWLRLVPIC